MEQTEKLIRDIPKGLLNWYDFKQYATVLYIGAKEDALAEVLTESCLQLTCVSLEDLCKEEDILKLAHSFDYIVCIEALERHPHPEQILQTLRGMLKSDGTMLLGMNNRFGLRYFCGDRDYYTERNFDGIEGYRRAYSKKEDVFRGRCYSRAELKVLLQSAGWQKFRFYSVLSNFQNPNFIYAEDYLPNEDLSIRVFPTYSNPNSVFLEERSLYNSLAQNGMFHEMANAYLIECSLSSKFSDINHVTSSMERGREDALITIIRKSGVVEKRAAYPEGSGRLTQLMENGNALRARGISVVDARLEGKSYVMPYVHGESGHIYLQNLFMTNQEKFLQEMDRFREMILQSSEIVKPDEGDGQGAVLSRGYLDMMPLNSFYVDGEFVFYDQEICEENYPANAIITRAVDTLYMRNPEMQSILPREDLYERYGLAADLQHWRKLNGEFLSKLRKDKELRRYHEKYRSDYGVINSNRQRMNYSEEEYQRLFVDIFRNADTRKLILFGSGNFTKRFLTLYSQDYPVYAVIDNNEQKWGQEIEGPDGKASAPSIKIQSPELLHQLQNGEYKVIICIKNYLSVMKQLDQMGVKDYSIFDSNKDYPRKRRPIVQTAGEHASVEPKKYHTGYIAGVFDLFHVGHLNMFKRAKEQCEYLIVGVLSDEGVLRYKEKAPFIPFEERIEMVRSCRYVDEAVAIPLDYNGTRDAYKMYHFDCQFSGSDYVDDPNWLANKAFLEKNGAELVFFPYTEQTSSTKIKALIEQGLL